MAGLLPARILLVDDREENLLALEAILGGLGHDLLRATSGAEALKHLLMHDVSLIRGMSRERALVMASAAHGVGRRDAADRVADVCAELGRRP